MSALRVVVTRSSDQASRLSQRLRDRGFEPVEVPLIEVWQSADHRAELSEVVGRIHSFDWVALTSPNAADAFLSLVDVPGAMPKVAAVGPGTAERISHYGVEPAIVAETSSGRGLVVAMTSLTPSKVLIPQAAAARPDVVDGLRALGWKVTTCVAYETVAVRPADDVLMAASQCEVIAFASSSSVEAWASAWAGADDPASALRSVTPHIVVSIGPQTTATATMHGLTVAAEADPHTLDGLVAAVGTATALLLG